jgi:hypothetical protein
VPEIDVTDGEGTGPSEGDMDASSSPRPTAPPPSSWPSPGAAAPGRGPDQGWAPPPPAPKRKLKWLWIVIGVLAVVAVVVVALVFLFFRRIGPPIDATNVVLRDVKRGDYAAGYTHSCSRNRDDYTLDEFRASFENAQRQLGHIKSFDVDFGSVHGSRATTKYQIHFARGSTKRYEASVYKEHGKWRACLLKAP